MYICSMSRQSKPLRMVSPVALHGCPRCDGPLDLYDRFPRCVVCGWEDYRDHDELRNGGSLTPSRGPESFPDKVAYRGDGPRFAFSHRIEARLAATWRRGGPPMPLRRRSHASLRSRERPHSHRSGLHLPGQKTPRPPLAPVRRQSRLALTKTSDALPEAKTLTPTSYIPTRRKECHKMSQNVRVFRGSRSSTSFLLPLVLQT